MRRVAIFVDAGYLFAQGSTALTGAKKPRSQLKLNETAAVAELSAIAQSKSGNAEILRVYWYDGAVSYKGPSLEQIEIAHLDNVKLRLGFINSFGQQKGVDSLIVTDLIDLARNHAISDAVLLSGDEDVRIGVQIAQGFGIRVHLIGIHPSRGSQSKQLLQEADTTSEWDKETVAKFLSVQAPVTKSPAKILPATAQQEAATPTAPRSPAIKKINAAPELLQIAEELADTLDSTMVLTLKSHWTNSGTIPPEFDGKLLARAGEKLGRQLDVNEKKQIRAAFRTIVTERG